ncbi:MAG: hypothetical protein ABIA62_06110 [Candidatus Woesearchaeota archaeon]
MSIRGVDEIDDLVPVRVVLASVFDKSGLEELVPGLLKSNPGLRIISTGGTYAKIKGILGEDAAVNLMSVDDFTGAPETEGGLVKTLSREKSLALLTETYCESHQRDLRDAQIAPIDIVICNLYPFAEVIARPDTTPEIARGNIDIGGPCMVREAAKNYLRCASIVDPKDYPRLIKELEENEGHMSFDFRLSCMKKAFAHVADYNRQIADYFADVSSTKAQECYRIIHEQGY